MLSSQPCKEGPELYLFKAGDPAVTVAMGDLFPTLTQCHQSPCLDQSSAMLGYPRLTLHILFCLPLSEVGTVRTPLPSCIFYSERKVAPASHLQKDGKLVYPGSTHTVESSVSKSLVLPLTFYLKNYSLIGLRCYS